jgi:hypothetical protein
MHLVVQGIDVSAHIGIDMEGVTRERAENGDEVLRHDDGPKKDALMTLNSWVQAVAIRQVLRLLCSFLQRTSFLRLRGTCPLPPDTSDFGHLQFASPEPFPRKVGADPYMQ